jgi:hypothetical protein
MTIIRYIIMMLLIASNAFGAYTITSGHPRIWFTSSDLSTYRARMDTGGVHETAYGVLTSWCDNNISATMSSSLDWDEHLTKFALAHIFDPEGDDTTYGDRVKVLLNYLADNAQGWGGDWDEDTDRSGGDDSRWWQVPTAVGVAYDWAYDRINGTSDESDIEAYIQGIFETDTCDGTWSGTACSDWGPSAGTWYKTEENWGAIVAALAIAGEQDSTNNGRVSAFLDEAESFLTDGLEGGETYKGSLLAGYEAVVGHGYFTYQDGYQEDVSNAYTYIAAWHTATSQDLTSYGWWQNTARGLLAIMPPDGYYPKIGETQPYGTTESMAEDFQARGTMWYRSGAYFGGKGVDNYAPYESIESSRSSDDWALVSKLIFTTGAEDYTELDRAYHFDTHGGIAFRSGWNVGASSDDIVGEVRGYLPFRNKHCNSHDGHLDLRRGNDYVLIQAGHYYGSTYNNSYSDSFDQTSDSSNTIHIDNIRHRSQEDGDTMVEAGTEVPEGEFGQTTRFQYVDGDYVYSLFDMTKAFYEADVNHTTGKVYRSTVFLDDKWVIVHDYIDKVTASDTVEVDWNMMEEPADDGSGWTDSGQTASAAGTTSSDADVCWWTTGDTKTYLRVVEPVTGFTLGKLKGSWNYHATTISGTVYSTSYHTSDYWGQWRVETKIANPGTTKLDFLHVIQAVDSGASEETVERITGTNYVGACIRATTRAAALFSTDGADHAGVSFSVTDTSGTLKATVANLEAATYTVNGSGSYVVDSDGVLYFEADLSSDNSFVVAQGEGETPASISRATVSRMAGSMK